MLPLSSKVLISSVSPSLRAFSVRLDQLRQKTVLLLTLRLDHFQVLGKEGDLRRASSGCSRARENM